MKLLLSLASAAEAATGLALLIAPQIVVRLLSGNEVADVGIAVSRIAGIALVAFGVSCWPRTTYAGPAFWGMLVYSVLVTPYLVALGVSGEWTGNML